MIVVKGPKNWYPELQREGKVTSRIGAAAELRAAAWLMGMQFDVFRNMSPTGPADLIALNLDTMQTTLIDVKAGRVRNGVLTYGRLTKKQEDAGVRIVVVTDDWVGWPETHPSNMLAKVVEGHAEAKKNVGGKPTADHPWKKDMMLNKKSTDAKAIP